MAERITQEDSKNSQYNLTLGYMIRSLRLGQNLQAKEAAKKAGVSAATWSQWEHNRRRPQSLNFFTQLLTALNPNNEEKYKLLELAGIPANFDTLDNSAVTLASLERRLTLAESLSTQLIQEIVIMRSMVNGLRLSTFDQPE